jgi:hypothetical protein
LVRFFVDEEVGVAAYKEDIQESEEEERGEGWG